jgi:hypothetical protein
MNSGALVNYRELVVNAQRKIVRDACAAIVCFLRGDLSPTTLSNNNSFNSRMPRVAGAPRG